MVSHSSFGSLPEVTQLGDVVGIQFPFENELVLFMACSGDVLLCTASEWHGLDAAISARVSETLAMSSLNGVHGDFPPASDLERMLVSLGARLDFGKRMFTSCNCSHEFNPHA